MKKQADKRYGHESKMQPHAISLCLYRLLTRFIPHISVFCIYWVNLPISLFISQAIPITKRPAFPLHHMLRQPNCVHQKAPENKSPMLLSIPNALTTIPITSFT
ncbi:hypothetical protein ABIC22_000650 [Paenibacillus sp. PvP094]